LAPEICNNQKYDTKIDVWTFGIILYELWYGKNPFDAETKEKSIRKIQKEKLIFQGHINKDLRDLIKNCL